MTALTSLLTSPRYPGRRLPPSLPGGLPWLGHALDLGRRPVEMLLRGREQVGDIFSFRLPGTLTVMMLGPRAHEVYFRLPDDQLSQREVYQLMVPIFGKGIAYDAPPEIMKEQVAFLHAALRENRMREYAGVFVDEAEQFFGAWKDEGVVDLCDVGNELTLYTSSRTLLGKKFRDQLSSEFVKLYQDLELGLSLVAFLAPNLPTPNFRRRDAARARMGQLVSQIIRERKARPEGADFLEALMEVKYSDGRALTDDEITGLLLTIMFAGHHTSGMTMAWMGVHLLQHPRFLQPLLAEQARVLDGRTDVRIEDLRAMEALDRVIKETLRLRPPIILLARRVLKGFEFDGYEIPEGAMVMTSPAASQRLPEVFSDPDRFDPDRFGPERDEEKKQPHSLIAFGAGRHRCVGAAFAHLQLRAIWSVLLRNFELELVEPRYEPDYSRMLVGPRQPCRVRYRRLRRPISA